jgi:hypothetical protein
MSPAVHRFRPRFFAEVRTEEWEPLWRTSVENPRENHREEPPWEPPWRTLVKNPR